jgi:hypothetical protein
MEPRKAILDMFKDVFFNSKKPKNMVLAVRNLDPLEVFLRLNRTWQQHDPDVLIELMDIILHECRGAMTRTNARPSQSQPSEHLQTYGE